MVSKQVVFEQIGVDSVNKKPMMRAKVPGGWLVVYDGNGMAFLPDPNHKWDGSSLPG